ncbi:hypothetical protein ABW21_db0207509 [Orbilia brochopaga]|nr:hypothetical protein ABW21_db0207509 [Drechslerella brochopaga]
MVCPNREGLPIDPIALTVHTTATAPSYPAANANYSSYTHPRSDAEERRLAWQHIEDTLWIARHAQARPPCGTPTHVMTHNLAALPPVEGWRCRPRMRKSWWQRLWGN